jgi:glyoxylase-like metal-dependent hydrolase (beta-lactamase superfamily II)
LFRFVSNCLSSISQHNCRPRSGKFAVLKLPVFSNLSFKEPLVKFLTQSCAAFFWIAFASAGAQAAEALRDYPLSKIAAHTYVIHGPLGYPSVENQGFMNNPGFVITRSSVVVIDPGSSVQTGRLLLKKMREVTRLPVSHVFNTHVHGDHWLGNQAIIEAFPNALLIAHPDTIKKLNEGEGESWVALMDKSTKGFTRGTKAVVPSVATNDGAQFKIGGMTFRIYAPANAHSHTDIMIEATEESVIFTGDNVTNQTIGRMVDGTFTGNIAACDKIAALNAKHYVPGHGPTGDVSIVKNYRQYLATLFDSAKRQYAQGKADFEMKDSIVALLKPYQAWDRFNDEVGKHIGLAVQEIEAAM